MLRLSWPLLLLAVPGCSGSQISTSTGSSNATPPASREPARVETGKAAVDIIVVLENGLRSDLGAPGAEAALFTAIGHAPLLRYTNVSVQSVHPFLSIGSMLTGRYPSAVPLCSIPIGPKADQAPWCAGFPATVPTIPEVLAIYGYRTALALTPPHLREHQALAGEFDAVIDAGEGAGSLVDASLEWWNQPSPSPRLLVVVDNLSHVVTRSAPPQPPGPVAAGVAGTMHAAYATAAAKRGAEIGRLIAGTAAPVRAAPAGAPVREVWAVVTSAHGLSIAETTGTPSQPLEPVQHDILLERTLHVPLVVYGPPAAWTGGGTPPLVVGDVRELVDIVPTLAHLARVMAPAGIAGRDLLETGPPPVERVAYAEFGDMLAARSSRYLLLARLWMHGGTALDPEITRKLRDRPSPGSTFTLHDIVADPLQATNLVTDHVPEAAVLYDALLALRTGPGAPPAGGLTAEQVAKLRASGALNYW